MANPYRVPVLEHFAWQPPVKSLTITTTPPAPARGDRYIVPALGSTVTGAWFGHDNEIAYCSNATGPVWSYDVPLAGWEAYVEDEDQFYYFDGAVWKKEVAMGASGYSGYSGQSGYSGYSGTSGYSGYSGISGYSGYSGESGYSGYSGISGYSGYSGESGYSGYSGESGYSGYSGISGYSGYSGESGYSGYSGISGYSGYSGISGYSGYSGESGYSGYSGLSGYSGYSGPSGYSGYSGISGWSGSPGTLVGITYYTDDDASDTSGFKRMPRSPDADPEVTYSAVGTGGGVLIKDFLTILGDPGVNLITNGTWQSNVWAYIDSAGGTNTVLVEVLKRASGGAETSLFTMETADITDIGAYAVGPYEVMSAQGDISLLATDRLIFRYYAKSTAGKTISIAVGGAAHYTHVHTPLITQGYSGISGFSGYSGIGTSGYSGYSGESGYSGYSGPSGYSGYSGPSGYSGYSGESGYSGYSGTSGYSGYSGESGYSGYSGESGYSGYSGQSGYSGYSGSGVSGYSGYSGISGYSGPGAVYDTDYFCLIISG